MKKFITIAIVAVFGAGCASTDDEYVGGVVQANMDAQIIDKVPAEGAPEGDAQVAAAAAARYKTGQVKAPEGEEAAPGGGEKQ
jgi:hypothetical protein